MPKFNRAFFVCLSVAVAATPLYFDATSPSLAVSELSAKEGKAGGNSGGNGGGNGDGGNSGGKSSASGGQSNGKSSGKSTTKSSERSSPRTIGNGRSAASKQARAKSDPLTEALADLSTPSKQAKQTKQKAAKPQKTSTAILSANAVPKEKPQRPLQSSLKGLNSLNRSHKALMNTSDPRMAAIRDFAIAYATYELASGIDSVPTDPTLSDDALRVALEAAANPGVVVDDRVLDWAKSTLGVGSAIGKIDEIRGELASLAPVPTDGAIGEDTQDDTVDNVVTDEAAVGNTDDGDTAPSDVDPDAAGGAVVAPTEIAGTQPATAPIAD